LRLGYGVEKYGPSGLLASSADRGWSGLSAELRAHEGGVIAWKNTQEDIEICVDVRGSGSVVTRRGGGFTDRTVAERGTIWVSPAGLQEECIDISDPLSGVLHIYLPPKHFSPDSLGVDLGKSALASLRYETSFHDPLLAEIAYAIMSELQAQTSAGRLLAETLASSLAARLVQNQLTRSRPQPLPCVGREGLDRRRLARVLDHIEANLEGDLAVDALASIACLSRFHFARAFKAAVGRSPHRYVSAKRLERAKTLLARSDRPLVDIALALDFSCQANFTRAFRQSTGRTPGQYRRNRPAPIER
jgi:AraC family transcriptional regulator